MEVINAIAKVRFSSARPQRVQLRKADGLTVELVCMEPGQKLQVKEGQWSYYVVTGTAVVTCRGNQTEVPTGQVAVGEAGEAHSLDAAGERRLVCLAVGSP